MIVFMIQPDISCFGHDTSANHEVMKIHFLENHFLYIPLLHQFIYRVLRFAFYVFRNVLSFSM